MKKRLATVFYIFAIIILVYLISFTEKQIQDSITHMNMDKYYFNFVFSSICFFLIGFISIRNQDLILYFWKKTINIVPFIIGILLLIIGSIPVYIWILQFGWENYGVFKMMLYSVDANHAFCMISGVMIRESLIIDTK